MTVVDATALRAVPEVSGRDVRGALAVGGGALGMAAGFGTLVLGSVFMVPLAEELGWSRSEISAGYAWATIGMATGGLFWGRVSDRANLRLLLISGGAFTALPLAGFAVMTALWQYWLGCFLVGAMGFGCLYAPLLSASGEWFPRRRGLVLGLVTAGGAVGQGVLPYIAAAMIEAVGWRTAYVAIAILLGVIQAVVALTLRRAQEAAAPTTGPTDSFRFMSNPRLVTLSVAAFLCCACMGMPLIHLAGFVAAICGNPVLGSTSLLVAMLCGAVGRVCFGAIADRTGNLPAYMLASAIQTACLLAFPWLRDGTGLLALSAVFGFGFAGNMTCLLLCIRDEVPAASYGAAIGPVMFLAWVGMGVGGVMGGAVFDAAASYAPAFMLAAAFGAGNLLLLWMLPARYARKWLRLSPTVSSDCSDQLR